MAYLAIPLFVFVLSATSFADDHEDDSDMSVDAITLEAQPNTKTPDRASDRPYRTKVDLLEDTNAPDESSVGGADDGSR